MLNSGLDTAVQRMTLRSIFWPGGGNGGRAPLGCPLTFSFSILSLTCNQHKACLVGAVAPINHRKIVYGRSCCHLALVGLALLNLIQVQVGCTGVR